MRRELSILIPIYNDCCTALVRQVESQAQQIDGFQYEIIIGDDGSDKANVIEENRRNEALPHCRYLRFEQNRGRSAIRNSLAKAAKYQWLLFIDGGHMRLCKDSFLLDYLSEDDDWQVLYGGYQLETPSDINTNSCLRYKYERRSEQNASARQRNENMYLDFHSANFMVRRDVFQSIRFDEHLRRYGYEDVLFGKKLSEAGIAIRHIDNPTLYTAYEDNAVFLGKTEESLLTLKEMEDELRDYSRLITTVDRLERLYLAPLFRLFYQASRRLLSNNLTSSHPSLLVFNLYKIGFYLSI